MQKLNKVLAIAMVCMFFTSCYSVRLRSINGAMQPDPLLTTDDYYRGMQMVELDTVIKIDPTTKDFTYLIKETDVCKTGKLHTVEFRSSFGGLLLNTITFGRHRKLKVKYVCMKPTN